MKQKIKQLLNNQVFEKSIMMLIFLNLLVFILDSMVAFHNAFNDHIRRFEVISIAIFTVEYFLRVITIDKFKDLFKPMMLIDFFAVVPFYLSFVTVNTVFLRVLRFSRILRILKVGRYSQALDNIINAFKVRKEELIITFSIFAVGILLSAIFMYFAENSAQPNVFSSIPKCLYFSVITFTSVGFGDITPVTKFGEFICSLTAIFGIALHGLFVGVIGMAFMAAFKNEDKNEG